MSQKAHHQVPQEDNICPADNKSSEISSENAKGPGAGVIGDDVNSNDVHVSEIKHNVELDHESRTSVRRKNEGHYHQTRQQQLQLAVLVWLFLEKFMEIVVVFLLTVLAIKWGRLLSLLQVMFWPLIGLAVSALIALCGMRLITCCRRYPGCFLPKLVYLIFLTDVFFLLAVHAPIQFPFLSSYFALIAAGTTVATYMLLAFICITHEHFCKVEAKGCSIWLYGLLMPAAVLALSQPIYLYGGIGHTLDYKDFMINIGSGLLISLIITYETVFIDQRFVNSNRLDDYINTPGLLPGFVTVLAWKPDDGGESGGMKEKLFLF